MNSADKPAPISAVLRRIVAEAVEQGRTSYLALERVTGVHRASIRRFVTGERTLRLDVADQLAAYFKLELRTKRKGG